MTGPLPRQTVALSAALAALTEWGYTAAADSLAGRFGASDSRQGTLRVALDEIVHARDVARGLPAILARLNAGEVPHLILSRRNEPQGVLLTVERYEQLLDAEARHE